MSFPCQFCHKFFSYKSHYKRHLKTHLKHVTKDSQKNQVFKEFEDLELEEPNKIFECPTCHKKFVTEYNLDRHINKSCNYAQICHLIRNSTLSKKQKENINKLLDLPNKQNNTYNTRNEQVIFNDNNINLQINVVNIGEENLEMIKNSEFVNEIILVYYDQLI